MYGGETIALRRGETRAFTERIAKHLAGQLVYKILLRQKKEPYTDPSRKVLIGKMLGEVVAPPPEPIREEAPAPAVAEKEEEFPEVPKEAPKKRKRRVKK